MPAREPHCRDFLNTPVEQRRRMTARPRPKRRSRSAPLDFADPAGLTASLRGAGTLCNTYWVRFPRAR